MTVIDDYGHHPTEIRATLAAARACRYRRIHVLFQPHRYTRTQALMDDFARAFHQADTVHVMDIYAASEPPIEGVTARGAGRADSQPSAIAARITRDRMERGHRIGGGSAAESGDAIVTLGAGSVSQAGDRILERLRSSERATKHTKDELPAWTQASRHPVPRDSRVGSRSAADRHVVALGVIAVRFGLHRAGAVSDPRSALRAERTGRIGDTQRSRFAAPRMPRARRSKRFSPTIRGAASI